MAENTDDFNERLKGIADSFKSELPGRLSSLRKALDDLPETTNAARHLAHKLAGSCGIFGLTQLGEYARGIETTLDTMIIEERSPSVKENAHIENLYTQLESEVNQDLSIDLKVNSVEQCKSDTLIYAIDDDEDPLNYIVLELESRGYTVEGFTSLHQAKEACRERAPNAVLLDVMFPDEDVDGISAASDIRDAVGKAVPIILMSASQDMAMRVRAAESVASCYMTKPIDIELLEKKLDELLKASSEPTYRVALIDDDKSVTDYYESLLNEQGYRVLAINDSLAALGILQEVKPDLIVLDLSMPGVTGTELAKVIRQDAALETVPIVFLSGVANPRLQEDAISVGGQEFLQKPVSDSTLLETVRRYVTKGRELSSRIAAVSRLDPNTGLVARRYFAHYMEDRLEHSDAEHTMALLYIWVPQFTAMINNAGLENTEELISLAGKKIETLLDETAVVSHLAPGVFGAIVEEKKEHSAEAIAKTISEFNVRFQDKNLLVKTKIGVALLADETGSAKSVLESIHQKLAAHDGEIWVNRKLQADLTGDTISLIKDALKNKSLRLFFKGIVCVDESLHKLSEALVRLELPNGKLVSAKVFAPVAEELGVTVDIDRALTMGVIGALDAKKNADIAIEVFIPLSNESFYEDTYLGWLESSLIFTPIDSKHTLVLCMDQSSLLRNVKAIPDFIEKAGALGCKVAMRGYTGHPGLAPVFNFLKLDYVMLGEKLTADYESKSIDQRQFISAIDAAKRTGSRIIACGVQEPRTVSQLWRIGVRDYQGYMVEAPTASIDLSTDISEICM